jgi:hypothetical protein
MQLLQYRIVSRRSSIKCRQTNEGQGFSQVSPNKQGLHLTYKPIEACASLSHGTMLLNTNIASEKVSPFALLELTNEDQRKR